MKTLVLFCGAGGASEGLRRAGCEIVGALDDWRAALLAHRRWHPRIWTVKERVERAHEIAWSPAIVWASPSCKPWSAANRTPKRGTAHREYYSLAHLVAQTFDHWRARWLIVENVCGLLWSKEGKVEVQAMREACATRGLRMLPNVVNSNTVGVAQIRRRLFIVVGPEYVKIPHGTDYIPPWNTETPPMACEGSKGLWERETRWPKTTRRSVTGPFGCSTDPHTGVVNAIGQAAVAECCALQQVPEHVVAGLPKRVAHELVGNCVPPPLAEHVARLVIAMDARCQP